MKIKAKRFGKGFTLVELLVVIAIIVALAAISTPVAFAQIAKAEMAKALTNGKEVSKALILFDQDYGNFPDNDTVQIVATQTGATPRSGSTSNDYLSQLITAGTVQAESIFYAKTDITKKPDNNISGVNALAAGECGFTYVLRSGNRGLSSSSSAGLPVLMSHCNSSFQFNYDDTKPFQDKAIVIRVDGSGETPTINGTTKGVNALFPTDANGASTQNLHIGVQPQPK